MIKNRLRRVYITVTALVMAGALAACGTTGTSGAEANKEATTAVTEAEAEDVKEIFTERDLEQTADLSEAEKITLTSGQDVNITKEGVYVLSDEAEDVTVNIEADDQDKVQIVLDGVTVKNSGEPFIYVKSADKVFVTTTESENSVEVSGEFKADGDTNVDAAIFSKDDMVLNGLGTLNITSSDNAVSCKDTLKITGSTLNISCSGSGLEAHDAVKVYDGTINITECNDGIHAEDNDDDSIGAVYIAGGTFNITAEDDAIHATTTIDINGGNFTLNAGECIEGTYITINDGTLDITASDDGINAAQKSDQYTPTFILNGGTVTVNMGAGDTDGVDSNGNIYINGGTISITGQSTFDYDGEAEYNGGTIIENGEETNTISSQTFGPGGMGGPGEFRPDGDFQPDENFQPDESFRPDENFKPDDNFRPDRKNQSEGGEI